MQTFNDVFKTACFEHMLFLQTLEFALQVLLHLLHAVLHVQDGFDAGKVDAEVAHEAADVCDAINVTVGIETRAVGTVAFARRGN